MAYRKVDAADSSVPVDRNKVKSILKLVFVTSFSEPIYLFGSRKHTLYRDMGNKQLFGQCTKGQEGW